MAVGNQIPVCKREERNMSNQSRIIIKGLHQNNLKNVSLEIPKGKIVFTGVSGPVIQYRV